MKKMSMGGRKSCHLGKETPNQMIFNSKNLTLIVYYSSSKGTENFFFFLNPTTFKLEDIRVYSKVNSGLISSPKATFMNDLSILGPVAFLHSQIAQNYSRSGIVTLHILKINSTNRKKKFVTLRQLLPPGQNFNEYYYIIRLHEKKRYKKVLYLRFWNPRTPIHQKDLGQIEFSRSNIKIWDFSKTMMLIIADNINVVFFYLISLRSSRILKRWFLTKMTLAQIAIAEHRGVERSSKLISIIIDQAWNLKKYQYCPQSQDLYLNYSVLLRGGKERHYLFKVDRSSFTHNKMKLITMAEIRGDAFTRKFSGNTLSSLDFQEVDFENFDSEHLVVQDQFEDRFPEVVFSTLNKTTHEMKPLGHLHKQMFYEPVKANGDYSIFEVYKLSKSNVLIVTKYGTYIYNARSEKIVSTKLFLRILSYPLKL